MREEWLNLRERLLFTTTREDFSEEMHNVREHYRREHEYAVKSRKTDIEKVITEITVDLTSYLKNWYLQAGPEPLTDGEIQKQAQRNIKLLEEWGAEKAVKTAQQKTEEVQNSNMLMMSVMTDEGKINNRWGNDFTSGLAESMRKGAVLATTNPPLINQERKQNPGLWDVVKKRLKNEYPHSNSEKLASILTMEVVLKNCLELRPVYHATDGRYGYVSLQVSPRNAKDSMEMIRETRSLHTRLEKSLNGTPNVAFKIPGTKAGVEAARVLTQEGICVTITVSFSFDQHVVFAEAVESGKAPVSYIVMMSGRLDDPISEELARLGMEDASEVAKFASRSVISKSYNELYVKRGYKRSALLTASLRGPWNIEASITDGKAPVYITSFPDKTEEYDSVKRHINPLINSRIPDSIMKKLQKSSIFRHAYGTDPLSVNDFDDFYPVAVTLNSFIESYVELVKYLES